MITNGWHVARVEGDPRGTQVLRIQNGSGIPVMPAPEDEAKAPGYYTDDWQPVGHAAPTTSGRSEATTSSRAEPKVTFNKAHIKQYQRRDGSTVKEHDDKRGKKAAPQKRPAYPPRQDGEDDKKYLKRIAPSLPDPEHLPEDHAAYFNLPAGHKVVGIEHLHSTKTPEENARAAVTA